MEQPSELKVVLTLKENRALICIQATDCDPYLLPGITLESEGLAERVEEALSCVGFALSDALAEKYPRYVKPRAGKAATAQAKGKAATAQAEPTAPVATETAQADPPATDSLSRTPELPLLGGSTSGQPAETAQEATERPQEVEGGPEPGQGPQEAPVSHQEPRTTTWTPGGAPPETSAPAEEPEVPPTGQERPARVERGGWVYYVKASGVMPQTGPFDLVHQALLAHGVSRQVIDSHKWWHRWDRLPKKYQDAIEKRKA